LLNKETNQLKLNKNIVLKVIGDTNVTLKTNELNFNGIDIVDNNKNITNTFLYDIYTLKSNGIIYNLKSNVAELLDNFLLTDKFNSKITAQNAIAFFNSRRLELNKLTNCIYQNAKIIAADSAIIIDTGILLTNNCHLKFKDYFLKTDDLDYNQNSNIALIQKKFQIFNDTFFLNGSGIKIDLKNKLLSSTNRAVLKFQKFYTAEFDNIYNQNENFILNGNIKIYNDTYTLSTNRLLIETIMFNKILAIHCDTIFKITANKDTEFLITSDTLIINFENNEIKDILIDSNFIANYSAIKINADSMHLVFENNSRPKKINLTNNLKIRYADITYLAKYADIDFLFGRLANLSALSANNLVFNDTLTISADNLKINFDKDNFKNFKSLFYDNTKIKHKKNNSIINANKLTAIIKNSKLADLIISDKIYGQININELTKLK